MAELEWDILTLEGNPNLKVASHNSLSYMCFNARVVLRKRR
jgi:hypothetical protein